MSDGQQVNLRLILKVLYLYNAGSVQYFRALRCCEREGGREERREGGKEKGREEGKGFKGRRKGMREGGEKVRKRKNNRKWYMGPYIVQ